MPQENGAPQLREPFRAEAVEEFRQNAYRMVDFICDYYSSLDSYPVLPSVQPGYLRELLPDRAPQQPQSFGEIMQDVKNKILPGMTHWQSPNFFAYFSANSSFPGILGEMLSAAFNIIGFSWRGCPAATDLETIVLDWLAKLLNLPEAFLATQNDGSRGKGGGVIQGTASEACLVALLAAKTRALQSKPAEDALKLVAYASDQSHSCIKKACMIAGDKEWALQPEVLSLAVTEDLEAGLLPFYLNATLGTTPSCAVDPIRGLGEVTQRHNIWMHVDAAYAGVTAMLPEMAQHFDGMELVDSFDTNPHKWLLTNFDVSTLYVKDAMPLKKALTLNPSFLQNKSNEYDYKDWQVPLGRRFRALKLWFVLRMYGTEGLQAHLRRHIQLAKHFAAKVQQDPRFELAATPRFSLVCFTLKGGTRKQNYELLEAVNMTGKAFLIHTELGGEFVLRLAVGAPATQQRHVDAVWHLLCTEADKILQRSG